MSDHLQHTSQALVATVRASLRALTADVEVMRGPSGSSAIRRTVEEAGVLSGALSRLDKVMDRLPAEAPVAVPVAPADRFPITRLANVLQAVADAAEHGTCPTCGGVLSGPAPDA